MHREALRWHGDTEENLNLRESRILLNVFIAAKKIVVVSNSLISRQGAKSFSKGFQEKIIPEVTKDG